MDKRICREKCPFYVKILFALLLVLTLFGIFPKSGHPGEVSGVVIEDVTGKPIAGVNVLLYCARVLSVKDRGGNTVEVPDWHINKTQSTSTDVHGKFFFDVDGGYYTIVAEKKGYFPYWYEGRYPLGTLDVWNSHDYSKVRLIIKMTASMSKVQDELLVKKK